MVRVEGPVGESLAVAICDPLLKGRNMSFYLVSSGIEKGNPGGDTYGSQTSEDHADHEDAAAFHLARTKGRKSERILHGL